MPPSRDKTGWSKAAPCPLTEIYLRSMLPYTRSLWHTNGRSSSKAGEVRKRATRATRAMEGRYSPTRRPRSQMPPKERQRAQEQCRAAQERSVARDQELSKTEQANKKRHKNTVARVSGPPRRLQAHQETRCDSACQFHAHQRRRRDTCRPKHWQSDLAELIMSMGALLVLSCATKEASGAILKSGKILACDSHRNGRAYVWAAHVDSALKMHTHFTSENTIELNSSAS